MRCILIPDDGRFAIFETQIDAELDGGWSSLWERLDGEPEELLYPGRDDVVAFVAEGSEEAGSLNNRATLLLRATLRPGGRVAGPLAVCGQNPDTGITDLPADVTVASIEAASREETWA